MTNLAVLKLLIASNICLIVTSFMIPKGIGDFGNSNADSRTTLNCATLGCNDCHEWCPQVSYMCPTVGKVYCRKTCGTCTNTHPVCVAKECDHRCILADDQRSAKCTCYEGYKLVNGNKCEEINECDTPNLCMDPKKPFCNEYGNSYTCSGCDSNKGLSPFYERDEGCCNVNAAETCGDSKNIGRADGRIEGGKNAKVGFWPWQAYLEFPDSLCGGSLISDQWVLTAAHCLTKGNPTTVMFGVLNITDTTNAHTQSFTVVKSVIHPEYKYPYNDIALLKIDRKPVQSVFAKPVCMPGGEKPAEGTRCYVTGFGTLESRGQLATHLQEVDVPIASMDKCVKNYQDVQVTINKDSMLCAGYDEGGKDACQGDSGGPLVCQRCSSCNWYIAGVVSFGKGCAQAKYYGVYANVVHFEDWVSQQIQETIPKAASCDEPQGTWGPWIAEGTCSAPCGGGQIKMTRSCSEWGACTGDSVRFDTCNEGPCATWSEYTWTPCSVTCGQGIKMGLRTCDVVQGSQGTCEGASSTQVDCTQPDCPGAVSTPWSECSASCGGGVQFREVDGQKQQKSCNDLPCPVWSAWTDWSACSLTCGGGQQTRSRDCNNGRHGDVGCQGDLTQSQSCNNQDCPTWGSWSDFGPCSVSCAGGNKYATRVCVGGSVGDDGCQGEDKKSEECNTQLCPVWGEWTKGACSVTCGTGGQVTYTRECTNGNPGDQGCEGSTTKTEMCTSVNQCPMWGGWGSYGACSVTCGDGTKSRTRSCYYDTQNTGCPGESTQTTPCNEGECGSSNPCSSLRDLNVNCPNYARSGFCGSYRVYMERNCAKSCCLIANPTCADSVALCVSYAGYCNYAQVSRQCKKTCGLC